MKKVFSEIQKFDQWWLWLLILGTLAVSVTAAIYELDSAENELETDPSQKWGLLFVFVIEFLLILIFWLMSLKTEIDSRSISIHFYPFVKRNILWADVKTAEVVNYGFIGGWGIRFSSKYGTVFNVKGKNGLAIVLKNNKKLLIGTQMKDELIRFLEERVLIKQ